jgi:hypothetical protein
LPEVVGHAVGSRWFALQLGVHDRERVVAGERAVPGQELVRHDPKGVDIRRGGGAVAADDLGGEVVDRAQELIGPGQGAGRRDVGDAEVGEPGAEPVVGAFHQDVLGL